MADEEKESLECPSCSNPIPMEDIEGKKEYECPNCEAVLELGDDTEEEVEELPEGEVESEERVDPDETQEESDKEVEKPAKQKRKKRSKTGAKNPEEVKKYLEFIKDAPNGVQAPMIAEEFSVSERTARVMIRLAMIMAETEGLKTEKKSGGKGERKTYFITD